MFMVYSYFVFTTHMIFTLEDMHQFFTDLACPGTRIQVSTLTTVLGYDGDSLSHLLLNNQDTDLYFLAGIDTARHMSPPHPRQITDNDIVRKRHVFFDFDIRKQCALEGREVTNDDIKWIAAEIAVKLSTHAVLSTWKYILFTGNGLHIYYVGDVFDVNVQEYKYAYDTWARKITYITGYEADPACKNPARIARMPGSYNNKKGKHTLVEIIAFGQHIEPSPLVSHILTYRSPMKEVAVQDVIHYAKTTPVKSCLEQLGYQFNDKNHLLEGDRETSITVNEQNNYIHRFSRKPGSGDLISFLMGYRTIPFLEACELVAHNLMNAQLLTSPHDKRANDIRSKAKMKDFMKTYMTPQPKNNKTWGLAHLDERFERPRDGDFILFLGEAGVGKTSMSIFMATQNAKAGVKTLFLSYEMSTENLITRYINTRAQITEEQRICAKYDNDQIQVMKSVIEEVNNDNLTWLDMNDVKDTKDWELTKSLMRDYDLIVIDNFSRIVPRGTEEIQLQSHISEDISQFVEGSSKTIVMIHHFAKKVGVTQRGLEARGSQKLIDDISIHVSISRDSMAESHDEDAGIIDFAVRKNRYGKTGNSTVKWDNGKYY